MLIKHSFTCINSGTCTALAHNPSLYGCGRYTGISISEKYWYQVTDSQKLRAWYEWHWLHRTNRGLAPKYGGPCTGGLLSTYICDFCLIPRIKKLSELNLSSQVRYVCDKLLQAHVCIREQVLTRKNQKRIMDTLR